MKNCQETKKKKVNKIRIKERLQMVALLCCASLATSISPVFADKIGDAANSAATGIQQSAVGLVKPLIIIVVVVLGLALLGVGGKRAKEERKDAIWEKLFRSRNHYSGSSDFQHWSLGGFRMCFSGRK